VFKLSFSAVNLTSFKDMFGCVPGRLVFNCQMFSVMFLLLAFWSFHGILSHIPDSCLNRFMVP